MNPWIIATVVGGVFFLLERTTPTSTSTTNPLSAVTNSLIKALTGQQSSSASKPASGGGGGGSSSPFSFGSGGSGSGVSSAGLNPPSWATGVTDTPYGGALDGTGTTFDSGNGTGTDGISDQESAVYGSGYDDNQFTGTDTLNFDGIDFGDVTDDSGDFSFDEVGGESFE